MCQCWEGRQEDPWGLLASQPSFVPGQWEILSQNTMFLLRNYSRVMPWLPQVETHIYIHAHVHAHTYIYEYTLSSLLENSFARDTTLDWQSFLCTIYKQYCPWLLLKTIMTELKKLFRYVKKYLPSCFWGICVLMFNQIFSFISIRTSSYLSGDLLCFLILRIHVLSTFKILSCHLSEKGFSSFCYLLL